MHADDHVAGGAASTCRYGTEYWCAAVSDCVVLRSDGGAAATARLLTPQSGAVAGDEEAAGRADLPAAWLMHWQVLGRTVVASTRAGIRVEHGYSEAVTHGDLVWVSGLIGRVADGGPLAEGTTAQARAIFGRIDARLALVGGTLGDVVDS